MPNIEATDMNPFKRIHEKYASYSKRECLWLYAGLLTRLCEVPLEKSDFLFFYETICMSFFIDILSKYKNTEYPDSVNECKEVFDDFLQFFYYVIPNRPHTDISLDELKIATLQAKVHCTETLKRNNDFYE